MTTRQKVLLPDDNVLFDALEQSFLQRVDVEVLMAKDGRETYAMAVKHQPKVVFLDLEHAGEDGVECCRRIKANAELSDTVVIMITMAGHPDEMAVCRDAGCDGILLKPIRRRDFMDLARKHLNVSVRAGARMKAEARVYYGPEPQKLLDNFSVDLSTGGLYIHTSQPLPENEKLTIRFSLPGESKIISCKARVAWVNNSQQPKKPTMPAGMGVQFIDLSLDDLHAIRRFLEHNELEPSW